MRRSGRCLFVRIVHAKRFADGPFGMLVRSIIS